MPSIIKSFFGGVGKNLNTILMIFAVSVLGYAVYTFNQKIDENRELVKKVDKLNDAAAALEARTKYLEGQAGATAIADEKLKNLTATVVVRDERTRAAAVSGEDVSANESLKAVVRSLAQKDQ